MENDVLKNKIAPWQEKGRWYHGVFNAATRVYDKSKTDQFLVDNISIGSAGGLLFADPGSGTKPTIKILDVKVILLNDYRRSSTGAVQNSEYVYISGNKAVSIAPQGTGHVEIWIFIVEIK